MSDELLRERYKDTMLGRVHLKLYRKITGHPSEIASPAAQRHFVVEQHRQNHVMGTFLIQLLGWPQFKDAEYAALCAPPEVPELLRSLEISPLERPFFLEVKMSVIKIINGAPIRIIYRISLPQCCHLSVGVPIVQGLAHR